MKRWAVGLLCMLLCGCSSEEDAPVVLEGGLYAYYGPEYTIAIGTEFKEGWNSSTYCDPGYITISDSRTGAYIFTQSQHIAQVKHEVCTGGVIAHYEGWAYENGLTILCDPKSATSFTGVIIQQTPGIALPGEVVFKKVK